MAPEIFISGVERVELIGGGCVRFVCFRVCEEDGHAAKHDALYVIIPASALPDAIRKAISAAGGEAVNTAYEAMVATFH